MSSPREIATSTQLAVEFKQPAIPMHQQLIADIEAFYSPKAITTCVERLLQGDTQAELDIMTYRDSGSHEVIKILTGWAEANHWSYIINNESDHHLTPRKWTWLGLMYAFGICTPPNTQKAISCYQKTSATDTFGLILLTELTEETPKKIEFYKKINSPYATYLLGTLLNETEQKGNEKFILSCFEDAAEKNVSGAIVELGSTYNIGDLRAIKNPKKAYECFIKASQRGRYDALVNIGIMHYKGNSEVSQNKNIAKQIFEFCVYKFQCRYSHLYLAAFYGEQRDINERAKHSYHAFSLGTDEKFLERPKKWLWEQFEKEQKSPATANPRVTYYATRAFQKIGDEKQKDATKSAFKKLDLGMIDQIACEAGETLEDLGNLIEPDATEREQLIIKFDCLFEAIPCFSLSLLEIVFQYEGFPLLLITHSIVENHTRELAAKEWLSVQKKHALMLFGKETAERISPFIQEAEERKTSSQSAVTKITPLLTAARA